MGTTGTGFSTGAARYIDDNPDIVFQNIPAVQQLSDGRIWIVQEMYNSSGSNIAQGKWVELDETKTTYKGREIALGTAGDARVVGVAAAAIPNGEAGPVLRYGVVNQAEDSFYVAMTNGTAVGPVAPAASGGSGAFTDTGPIIGYNLAAAGASGATLLEVRCLSPQQVQSVFSLVDLNGAADGLVLDADGDTTISAPTDDQIDVEIGGADDFTFTANTFTALSGSTIATDTIAETTAASGVTIDGCLVKDGAVAKLAATGYFVSTEQTGTGSSQNVAHGLSGTPSAVLVSVTEDPAGTGFDVAEGAHDGTNVVVTVTTGVKFKVLAIL